MSYAIMRIQKIKSKQALIEREKHNTRTKNVINANGSKNIIVEGHTNLSKHLDKLEKEVNSNNTRKTRKDAVRAIEVLFTSDKSFFKKVDYEQYFELCKEWLEETFETSKLYQYSIHLDEDVPHLHCIISTLKDGKFNYSAYINGRKDLRALQDSFYSKVKHLGLKRGEKVELTKETYTTNREWNKNIQKARNFAEALSNEKQFEYAIKGIMFTNEIEKINIENLELRAEIQDIKEAYENLREGVYNNLKGDYKTRMLVIDKLEQQGKNALLELKSNEIIPPTLEEMGLE